MKRPDFKILDMVNEFDLASDEHKQTIQDKKNRHDHLNMLSHEMSSFIKEREAEVMKLQVRQLSCLSLPKMITGHYLSLVVIGGHWSLLVITGSYT